MRNHLMLVLVFIPLMFGCGKKEDRASQGDVPAAAKQAEPPKNLAPIELTDTVELGPAITDPDEKSFKGLKVKAPKGSTAEAGLTGVLVKMGKNGYEVSKAFDPGYVAKIKGEAQTDTLDKVVKFHVDTPTAILWESASQLGGDNNFNFAAEVAVGDTKFKCGNKGYGQFNKVEAEALLKSCQSLTK